MSIFNRIAGIEQPRIPLLQLLSDAIKVMDGEVAITALEYETGVNGETAQLSQAEVAELGEYLVAFGARIEALVATAMKADMVTYRQTLQGADPMFISSVEAAAITAKAVLEARSIVRSQLEDYLLNAERGNTTESEFRSWVGLI